MSTQDGITNAVIRHQVFVQRFGAKVGNDFISIMIDLQEAAEDRLLNPNLTDFQRERLELISRDLEAQFRASVSESAQERIEELKRFGQYEAEFSEGLLGTNISGSTTLPSPEQISAAIDFAKMDVTNSGLGIRQIFTGFTDKAAKQVAREITEGAVLGETNRQISDRLGRLNGLHKSQAMTLTRTVTNNVSAIARDEVMRANEDVLEGYEWVAALDNRTTLVCASRDGKVYSFSDPDAPRPPAHFNCVLGDTLITSALGVSSVSKRIFKGEVIVINTVSGNKLTVTPNHPILTTKGWVRAKFLSAGDYCISQSDSKRVCFVNSNNDCAFKTAEQIFESFLTASNVSAHEVKVSAPDFHGDTVNNEIANIATANNLFGIRNFGIVQKLSKCDFYLRCFDRFPGYKSSVSLFNFLRCDKSTFSSFVGGLNKFFSILIASYIHSCLLLLRPISKRNPTLQNDSLDGTWTDVEGFSDSYNSDSSFVFADNIVSVERVNFCDHVYNLETLNHWYSANGIITHNCRSTIVPKVKPEFDLGADVKTTRTARSADGAERIDSDTNYEAWLRRQPASFQDEVLGRERGKLFRNKGIKLDRFVDANGKPIPLDQLKVLDESFNIKAKVRPASATIPKPVDNRPLFNGVAVQGKADAVKADDVLRNRLTPQMLAVVQKAEKPSVISTTRSGVYVPSTKSLFAGNIDKKKAVFSHEYGHHIDFVMNNKYNADKLPGKLKPISEVDEGFRKAFDADRRKLFGDSFDNFAVTYKSEFWEGYKKRANSRYTYYRPKNHKDGDFEASISDIIDSMAGGRLFSNYYLSGHGKKYYQSYQNQATEVFANLFALRNDKTEVGERARKYFPNLFARFDEMLDEYVKGDYD